MNNLNKKRNPNNNLNNVRSAYILQKIFDIIPKNKHLAIIRYNKKLQKRLDLSINNYKDYTELYTSIEIEIKIANNKYGKFINISDSDKEYYHIYFDDNKEEIKKSYLNKKDKVSKIKIIIDHQVKSFKKLFYDCYFIESIYFKKFYRNNITDMSSMFYICKSLKELDLSNFNTINVANMSFMFSFCSLLEKLNLSNFITKKVTNMSYMFFNCSSLNELNIFKVDTINVINMSYIFNCCSSLKELDLSNFYTINVINMSYMFAHCSS